MFPLEFLEYYGQYAFRILALRMAEIFQSFLKKSDTVRQFHNNSSSLVGLIKLLTVEGFFLGGGRRGGEFFLLQKGV